MYVNLLNTSRSFREKGSLCKVIQHPVLQKWYLGKDTNFFLTVASQSLVTTAISSSWTSIVAMVWISFHIEVTVLVRLLLVGFGMHHTVFWPIVGVLVDTTFGAAVGLVVVGSVVGFFLRMLWLNILPHWHWNWTCASQVEIIFLFNDLLYYIWSKLCLLIFVFLLGHFKQQHQLTLQYKTLSSEFLQWVDLPWSSAHGQ